MLLAGLIAYGKKVTEREFFLRRVTNLSIEVFLLLSAASFIIKAESAGSDVKEWMAFLEYYMSVIDVNRKRETRVRPDSMEQMHAKVFGIINRHKQV